ncbi:hypothetical protein EST38_g5571 [Candolleomyces aberdarensis]|uniref:Uncharacterized protein n=1 Tax=Candolleomyces aberdarensis TaxID=2316362 RepID=A0A4Q2DNC3_9AGAR|nr:hypothetical protein EST38_g5571 [Candolleomyces aberdarensis]
MASPGSSAVHRPPTDEHRLLLSPSLTIRDRTSFTTKLAPETIRQILQYATALDIDYFDDPTTGHLEREGNVGSDASYLGRVCREWHDVAVSTPSLWTHITAFVDTPHTVESLASSPLQTHLRLSFPLPISVYLRRKVKIPSSLDLDEQHSVMTLLHAVKDHFARVEALVIEANTSSSLPNALDLLGDGSEIFRQPLSGLKTLALRCNADDSILQPLPNSLSPQPPHRSLPLRRSLTTLYLDGRNLLEMLRSSLAGRNGRGVDSENVFSCMPMLEAIGVNNLTCCVDGFSEELIHHFFLDILPSFQRLSTLLLERFDLEPPQYPYISSFNLEEVMPGTVPTPLVSLSLPRLIIKHTKRESIGFVLRCMARPHTIVLDGCFLSSPTPSSSSFPSAPLEGVLSCSRLVLANLPCDFDRSLPGLIAQWDGEYLELIRCTCLGDDFWTELVRLLSPEGKPGPDDGRGRLPEQTRERTRDNQHEPFLGHLRSLKVIDCPNVHPDCLMIFLSQLRRARSTTGGGSSSGFGENSRAALDELVVAGSRSPKLETGAQMKWAKKLVSRTVKWSPLNLRH